MKKKILIISANFPYGKHETFLENEVIYLSGFFDIHILPIYKKKQSDVARKVPDNVTYSQPILKTDQFTRFLFGIFNCASLFITPKEILRLQKETTNFPKSLYKLYVDLINFRSILSNNVFRNALKNTEIDIIYFYWGNAPVKAIENQKPIFIRIHGGEIYKNRNNGYIPFQNIKFIKIKSTTYLPISEISAKHLKQFSPTANFILNRLGVFEKGINPYKEKDAIRIVSCSTLIPLKRVDLIVKSLEIVKSKKIEWIHFGDGPLFKEIEIQSQKLGENITVCLKGRLDNKAVLQFYKETPIDLFINVSETEGVPVSIMEALSFGIPCFATNVGGTGEIVDDTVGRLVDKDFKIEVLAEFIETAGETEKMAKLRVNARKRWAQRCDAEKNYKALVEIFQETYVS